MYLFDTDTITNVFKKKPSENLAGRLKNLDKARQFVSAVTVFEIVYGICKSSRPEYHKNNLESILLPSVNIIGFDMKSAYICGQLRAELEKKGQRLALADLQIASVAIANNLTLITGNEKHFKRIDGLNIENWL
jgi:tRNA(fMet)-specific endonuclease VapC